MLDLSYVAKELMSRRPGESIPVPDNGSFSSKLLKSVGIKDFPIEASKQQGLRLVRLGPIVAIEQSKNTSSRGAKLAREGHQVVVFREDRTHGQYLGMAVDGEYRAFKGAANAQDPTGPATRPDRAAGSGPVLEEHS